MQYLLSRIINNLTAPKLPLPSYYPLSIRHITLGIIIDNDMPAYLLSKRITYGEYRGVEVSYD